MPSRVVVNGKDLSVLLDMNKTFGIVLIWKIFFKYKKKFDLHITKMFDNNNNNDNDNNNLWYHAACKRWKSIGDCDTNDTNIQQRYRNGIWLRKMCYAHTEKWKKTKKRSNRTTKSRKNQNARRKGKLREFGKIGGKHDRKNIERVPQTN